jgi:multidrug resistance efflux pump
LIIGGSVLFFALRKSPAGDMDKGAGKPVSAETAASAAGKANLGYVNGDLAQEKKDQTVPETTAVEVVKQRKSLRVTGSLVGDELSNVASNVNGIVIEIRVDRGSVVKKGEVLVQLDPTDAKNRLSEGLALVEELKTKLSLGDSSAPFVAEEQPEVKLAKATLNLAKSRLKRAENLLPQKAISLDDFEQIRAEADCAEQRYQQAILQIKQTYQSYKTNVAKLSAMRKAVDDTTIKSPFDGVVVEKHVALGEQVTGGFIASKVITVVKTSPLRVSLTVPQQHIVHIVPGQKASFHVDSFPEKTFEAEIRYISPAVTSDTRSLLVEADGPQTVLRCPYHSWGYSLSGELLGAHRVTATGDADGLSCCCCPPKRVLKARGRGDRNYLAHARGVQLRVDVVDGRAPLHNRRLKSEQARRFQKIPTADRHCFLLRLSGERLLRKAAIRHPSGRRASSRCG